MKVFRRRKNRKPKVTILVNTKTGRIIQGGT